MTVKIVRTNPDRTETVVGVLGEQYAHMSRAAKLTIAQDQAKAFNRRAAHDQTGCTYRAEAS